MINSRTSHSSVTAGFSLLEVLVVIVIISILISFTTLTFDSEQKKLANEGERLVALMKLASEEAIMNSREYRVVFTASGYTFEKYDDGEWLEFDDDEVFRPRELPEDFSFDMTLANKAVSLDSGDEEEENRAAILFLSSGEVTPFELVIRGSSDTEVAISNRNGLVEVEQDR